MCARKVGKSAGKPFRSKSGTADSEHVCNLVVNQPNAASSLA
jgi:hypothetical protein